MHWENAGGRLDNYVSSQAPGHLSVALARIQFYFTKPVPLPRLTLVWAELCQLAYVFVLVASHQHTGIAIMA